MEAKERDLLRTVYEHARSFLRFNGVDRARASAAVDALDQSIEDVKLFDSGLMDDDQPESEPSVSVDDGLLAVLKSQMHYPECWDTACYPTFADALHEALRGEGCSICGITLDLRAEASKGTPQPPSCPRCGEVSPAEIHTCSPQKPGRTSELDAEVERLRQDADRYLHITKLDFADRAWVDSFDNFKAQRDAAIDAAIKTKGAES